MPRKIALIAHGLLPVPPPDWGAVEVTLWQRKLHLERRGHTVDIFNSVDIQEVIRRINSGGYDFAHCHREGFVGPCNERLEVPFAVTSHEGRLHQFVTGAMRKPTYEALLVDMLRAPANFVLSEPIRAMYERRGYRGFLRILCNAVETECFRFAEAGNGRAICLGRITRRKRQSWLAEIARGHLEIDFVGPWERSHDPRFVADGTCRYLGVWNRPAIHEHLTDYSCMALMSESEAAAPKVVMEALAAGVSVVVTEAAAANLTSEPFITVLPDDESRPEVVREAIRRAVAENPRHRAEARAYAYRRFGYPAAVDTYERLIDEFLAWFPSAGAAGRGGPTGGPARPDRQAPP